VIIMPLANEIRIEPYRPQHFAAVVAFVEALQDYERADIPELKPGTEIGQSYTDLLLRTVAAQRCDADGHGGRANGRICLCLDRRGGR